MSCQHCGRDSHAARLIRVRWLGYRFWYCLPCLHKLEMPE